MFSQLRQTASPLVMAFLFILLPSFSTDETETIVLKVADVTITQYELEKNLARFVQGFSKEHGRAPDRQTIGRWIAGFADRTYLLADAYAKNYPADETVEKSLRSMERLILSQPNGLVENELVNRAPAPDSAGVNKAMERSEKRIHARYLKFGSYDEAVTFMEPDKPADTAAFNRAVIRSRQSGKGVYGETILSWPFAELWEYQEYIFNLAPGRITPVLVCHDGSYIVHVANAEPVPAGRRPSRAMMMELLKNQQRNRIRLDYRNSIRAEAGIRINPDVLRRLEEKIRPYGSLHTFEKKHFTDLPSEEVLAYEIDGATLHKTVADFMEYYNYLPFRRPLATAAQCVPYIESIVYDDYAYAKADALGITKQREFLLDRENYKKSLIYNIYEERELKSGIAVTRPEIEARYGADKEKFAGPAYIRLSAWTFAGREQAFRAMASLKSTGEYSAMPGEGKNIFLHREIACDTLRFSEDVLNELIRLPDGGVSRMIEQDGEIIIIRKEAARGRRIRPLEEVYSLLERQLAGEKLETLKQERLEGLKKKYVLEDRIDYEKYRG